MNIIVTVLNFELGKVLRYVFDGKVWDDSHRKGIGIEEFLENLGHNFEACEWMITEEQEGDPLVVIGENMTEQLLEFCEDMNYL